MYKEYAQVTFPEFTGAKVNMMPFVFGDLKTIPEYLQQYIDIINQCNFEKGTVCYLTVHESVVKNTTQRRGGVHVEAPNLLSWGGGAWGGMSPNKGVYMASTDGACQVWDEIVTDRDHHGACEPLGEPEKMKPNTLYWMTDKTPHQALESNGKRQFIRIVSSEISLWFKQHNTKNPLGIEPTCEIVEWNKFKV